MSKWMNGGCPRACAYCGNPFPMKEDRIEAVRVGEDFVCNTEDCIDGIQEELPSFVTKGRMLS